jgi:hypothetical protein
MAKATLAVLLGVEGLQRRVHASERAGQVDRRITRLLGFLAED